MSLMLGEEANSLEACERSSHFWLPICELKKRQFANFAQLECFWKI
jgi:hypothetical protein